MEEKFCRFIELKNILAALYQDQAALAQKLIDVKKSYNESCDKVNELRDNIIGENYNCKMEELTKELNSLDKDMDFIEYRKYLTEKNGKRNNHLIILIALLSTILSFVFIPLPISLLIISIVSGCLISLSIYNKNRVIRNLGKLTTQGKHLRKLYSARNNELIELSQRQFLSNADEDIEKARLDRSIFWDEYMTISHSQNAIGHEILMTEAQYSRIGLELAEAYSNGDFDLKLAETEKMEILDEMIKILLSEKDKKTAKKFFFGNDNNF